MMDDNAPPDTSPKDDPLRASSSDALPVRKVKSWVSGLRFAALRDISVAYKIGVFVLILFLSLYARQWMNALFVSFATALVLMAELFNSAIERLCDYLTTEHDEEIRAIKDISAAAVGACMLAWFIVILAQAVHLIQFALL